MSGKLALFLLQLTTKKSFWATLVAILLTIIGFIGFLMFVLFGTALAGTYTAEDDVILAVDAQYSNMEKALSRSLQNGPALYPGYDEYVYNLAEVGHDGNILASYLSALHPRYTQNIVQSDLDALLAEQYMVSTYETIEIRERIVGYEKDPDDPDELIPIIEEYEYRILTISLSNNRLSFVKQLLNAEQQKMYDLYKMLNGNKPYLFPTYSPELGDIVLPEEIGLLDSWIYGLGCRQHKHLFACKLRSPDCTFRIAARRHRHVGAVGQRKQSCAHLHRQRILG